MLLHRDCATAVTAECFCKENARRRDITGEGPRDVASRGVTVEGPREAVVSLERDCATLCDGGVFL